MMILRIWGICLAWEFERFCFCFLTATMALSMGGAKRPRSLHSRKDAGMDLFGWIFVLFCFGHCAFSSVLFVRF